MSLPKVWHVIKWILYELQPFRLVDAVAFSQYACKILIDLCEVGAIFAVYLGKKSTQISLTVSIQTWVYIILWFAAWAAMIYIDFGSLWILLSMFGTIFLNLGTKKRGELSAYSVFNKGFKQLMGTMNAEQFDNEIRHNPLRGREGEGVGENIVQLEDVLLDPEHEDDVFVFDMHNVNNNHIHHQARAARGGGGVMVNQRRNVGADGWSEDDDNDDNEGDAGVRVVRRKGKKGRKKQRRPVQKRTQHTEDISQENDIDSIDGEDES